MVTSKARELLGARVGWATPPRSSRAVVRPLRTHHSTRAAAALIALSFGVFQGCAKHGDANGGARSTQTAQPVIDSRFAWEGDPGDAPWPVVAASWRDIAAGVTWAASNAGYAITGVEQAGPLVREYELVGLGGETGRVRVEATRLVEGALPRDPWITVEVALGMMGESEREAALRDDLLRYAPKHAR